VVAGVVLMRRDLSNKVSNKVVRTNHSSRHPAVNTRGGRVGGRC
jgi:hypothetical protein